MNAFQKQLKLGDKCMAELAGQDRNGIGQAVPPARVSVEEFEATQHPLHPDVCPECNNNGHVWSEFSLQDEPCPVCGGASQVS